MARDWEVSDTLADLQARMAKFGENIAPIPITMTMELRGNKMQWIVDIHIKVHRVTEFDISTQGESLSEALRSAYLGLNNEMGLLDRANRANKAFGIAF